MESPNYEVKNWNDTRKVIVWTRPDHNEVMPLVLNDLINDYVICGEEPIYHFPMRDKSDQKQFATFVNNYLETGVIPAKQPFATVN